MFYNFAQKICKKERDEKEVENRKNEGRKEMKIRRRDKRSQKEKRNRGR